MIEEVKAFLPRSLEGRKKSPDDASANSRARGLQGRFILNRGIRRIRSFATTKRNVKRIGIKDGRSQMPSRLGKQVSRKPGTEKASPRRESVAD